MASLKQILTFGTPSELSTLVKDEQNPLLPHSRLNVELYSKEGFSFLGSTEEGRGVNTLEILHHL